MQIAFIIGGIVVIVAFLFSLGAIFIRSMRDELNMLWYNISDKLQYRQDLLPNLIESIRIHLSPEQYSNYKDKIHELIELRHKAAMHVKCDADKIVLEHDLSSIIRELFQKLETEHSVRTSTTFLETKKQIKDIEKEVDEFSKKYNEKVRSHNKTIKIPFYILPAKVLKYGRKTIFEFE